MYHDVVKNDAKLNEVNVALHRVEKCLSTHRVKYRGLKSFRTSPWDPNENLPPEYARIYQFQNFQAAVRHAVQLKQCGDFVGHVVSYIIRTALILSGLGFIRSTKTMVAFSLLQHEHKMSVLNMVVRKWKNCDETVKSKDRLIFQVGLRRFIARPIFSQHTNGDKHKFERFLPNDDYVVATVFAPITIPPAGVIVYSQKNDRDFQLVATGSLLDVCPSRIVVKRVVLSGEPFKIHGRTAVVRHMFFNPEDIDWFKPVEIRTASGKRGHIKESLGTHGYMKCAFNGKLRSQDVIFMDLYKRVFPKWTIEEFAEDSLNLNVEEESDTNFDESVEMCR
ncbi:unnamed protein product [Soboliphyme baturini]|uniref:Pre-rRNA-processing protein TSR1 homolog n=1 Tax=Soboliphyme baturini TaxID=241478 RepID=A0A183IRH8_9BILA|nr:unnamed protein product [Soboliphyme baturini]